MPATLAGRAIRSTLANMGVKKSGRKRCHAYDRSGCQWQPQGAVMVINNAGNGKG